jgi:hypothetical protein
MTITILRDVNDTFNVTKSAIQCIARIGSQRLFYGLEYSSSMGCVNDKDLQGNLSHDPNMVVGSTLLRADQIVVLGDSVFLPTRNKDGEYQMLEIDIDDKKISVHRGMKNAALRAGLS